MCQCFLSAVLEKETPARQELELITSEEQHFFFLMVLMFPLCSSHAEKEMQQLEI